MAMLSLAFFIHSAVITLLKSNEKQENNTRDLSLGYLLVGLTYAGIGSLFFLAFPDNKECIGQNVLENLKKTDGLAIIARFFLFFQMGTVFPLLIFIFRVQFLYVAFKVIHLFSKKHLLILIRCATIPAFYMCCCSMRRQLQCAQ